MFYPKSPFLKYPEIQSQLLKWNPEEHSKYLQWLCTSPKITTYRVNLLQSNVEEVKSKILQELQLKYSKCLPEIFTINVIPEILAIKNIEKPLVHFEENNLKEIIVDIYCAAALLRGAHVYAPGVLAMSNDTKNGEKVSVIADIFGKCKKGTKCKFESDGKAFIGTGIVCMQRNQLFSLEVSPKGIAIEMQHTVSGVPCIGDLSSNCTLLQNFPSIVCSRVLDPQPNDVILDMCCAPGNKTTHIAELMMDNGIIMALDRSIPKINLFKKKINDYQFKSINAFAFDSTVALSTELEELNTHLDVLKGPPFAPEIFDRILLDAPCTAFGNRPVLSINLRPESLKSFPNVQKKLFTNAVALLKPGGILVYSTCTITTAENEELVAWANEKFKNLKLVSAIPILGSEGLSGCGLNSNERKLVQRFDVASSIDSVGFFIAKFLKDH